MTGTELPWKFDVSAVWVDNTSESFTQTGEVVDIPSYTSGEVLVESTLYMTSGRLAEYLPKDPTNPASDLVYWEDRVMRFPVIGTTIKNIESGIVSSNTGTLAFLYRDGWESLIEQETYFANSAVKVYKDGVLQYSGFSQGFASSRGVYTVTLGNEDSVLEKECTFGDPDYMVRIDRASSNSYYTGPSIPEKWDGQAIPMVFGPRSGWFDEEKQSVSKGQIVPELPPLTLPAVHQSTRSVGGGAIMRVIPTSQTTGILCRTPSFQTLLSNKFSTNLTAAFFWSKMTAGSTTEHPNLIYGQLVSFGNLEAARRSEQSGRFIAVSQSTNETLYELAAEDAVSTSVNNYDSVKYDASSHLCAERPASTNFADANFTISSTTITQGTENNKLWTVTATGVNFFDNDYYYVCSDINGAKSAPDVAEFILSSHGLPTDSSFATLGANLTEKCVMHVGDEKNIQTVNEALAEINESLLSVVKKNLDGTTYSIQKIEQDPTTSLTLTHEEIGSLRTNSATAKTYGVVEYEPVYLRGSRIRDQVYRYDTADNQAVNGIEKTKLVNHVLNATTSRMDEITKFWSTPEQTVGFILLDESIAINIGDYVSVVHDDFVGKIMVTSISPKDLGLGIQGLKI
jgi:hypothetical protein